MWLYGLFLAFTSKFFSSIDDVVWLTPFLTSTLTPALQLQNALIYTSVCLVQTFVAMTLAYSGEETVAWLTAGQKDAWSPNKILTVGAGCLMTLFGAKELYNHFYGDDEEGEDSREMPLPGADDSQTDPGSPKVATPAAKDGHEPLAPLEVESGLEIEATSTSRSQERGRGPIKLFQIAFIGSVDDLTLFVPMLVGKSFDPVQLVAGSLTAACIIVSLCIFIGLCKPIAKILGLIPLWAIVFSFAVILLSKGIMMD